MALFACAFLPLYAASLDDLTYTTTDGEVTITRCDQAANGELVIPNTIDGNQPPFSPITPFLPQVFRPNSFFTDFPPKANS